MLKNAKIILITTIHISIRNNYSIFVALEPAKPLNDAQMCGSFFYIFMGTKSPFNKVYTEPIELIKLLKSRGLSISDDSKVVHYLTHIGYYRLSAYMYPLLKLPKENHEYKEGASFEQVMMLYRFDKKLRLLLFNEIEKIEVAIRSAIVKYGCELTGNPFWMTEANNFLNPIKYIKTINLIDEELRHSKEDFIYHFKERYSNPYPPAWILAEILPFGIITNIYSNIKNKKIKKRISQSFNLQIGPFESWTTIITLTRNLCCHHARVWNKQNTLRPMIPTTFNRPWIELPVDSLRIYFNICIIKYFLDIISPGNDMRNKIIELFKEFPQIDLAALGFPKENWLNEPLWQDNN